MSSTLTKSDRPVRRYKRRPRLPPASRNSPPLPMILAIGKSLSAPTVAPMSRTRIFAASEARCRSEDCAKLHTLGIVEYWPHFRELILTGRCRHPGLPPASSRTFARRGRRHGLASAQTVDTAPRQIIGLSDSAGRHLGRSQEKGDVAHRGDCGHRGDTAQIQAGIILFYIELIFQRYL